MKRFFTLLITAIIMLASQAASADWYLYFYSDSYGLNGDAGQFQTTSTSNEFLLEGVSVDYSGIAFCVHNNAWSSVYGWGSAAVSSAGTDVELGTANQATGWLSIPTGTYDVTWNSSTHTIRFDEQSGGGGGETITGTVDNSCHGIHYEWISGTNYYLSWIDNSSSSVAGNITLSGTPTFYDGTYTWSGTSSYIAASYANFSGNTAVTGLTITADYPDIPDYFCYGCTGLSSVAISGATTTIGVQAFKGCTSLTAVALSSTITTIRDEAFNGCTSLATIELPSSLDSIGASAFYSTALTSVTIPASVTEISEYAFGGCASLATITFSGMIPPTIDSNWIYGSSSVSRIIVPAGCKDAYVEAIGSWAEDIIEEAGGGSTGTSLVKVSGSKLLWTADNSEVRLFGVGYNLPSACDFRAAGYVGQSTLAQKKAMIVEDLNHIKRMGFDALRLAFYGDYENTDASGNLVNNDHLDLLCYLIQEATARGIYMMLTPIISYDSRWPENEYSSSIDTSGSGFARNYGSSGGKWQLMYSTETPYTYATTYITQLLNYTNPYTNNAIKNEPNIILLEVLNEPNYGEKYLTYQSSFNTTYKKAINGYVSAIKATGCAKPIAFNVSQDMHVSSLINGTNVNVGTYAWYPFDLSKRYTANGNGLLWVDRYTQMTDNTNYPFSKPKVVYEFDSSDRCDGYTIPAMVREFRRGDVQFAAMYEYDMLRTAPYNLTNRTHYFNLVYTPEKAVSAMIAAEVMRQVSAGTTNTYYPANSTFGDFLVDHDQNLSVLNDGTHFYYSNNTIVAPKNTATIEHIAGVGSSPVVTYDGTGIYFLDKNSDGSWTLEVYPDITQISDPFKGFEALTDITSPNNSKVVRKSACNENNIYINLPSLQIAMSVEPGIYTLKNGSVTASTDLPAQSFYDGFSSISDPAASEWRNDATTVTLTDPTNDAWTRCRYSREWHSPSVSLSVDWDNSTKKNYYNLSVTSLATNSDYDNYGYYPDATLSIYVGDRIGRGYTPTSFTINAKRTDSYSSKALFLVVDNDGNAWGAEISLTTSYGNKTVNVSSLVPYKAAMIPQDWPGVNSYWYPASVSNSASYSTIDWSKVDFVQISLRKDLFNNNLDKTHSISIGTITMNGSRSLNLDEDAVTNQPYSKSTYNLTLSRTLKVNEWNTICLPIYLNASQIEYYFGSGTQLAEFTGINNGVLTYQTATYMNYNVPYLIKPTSLRASAKRRVTKRNAEATKGTYDFGSIWVDAYEPTSVTSSDGNYTFSGTAVERPTNQNNYAVDNKYMFEQDGEDNIKATEAYITVSPEAATPDFLLMSVDGVITEVSDIKVVVEEPKDKRIFNVQGQYLGDDLGSLPAGIYIRDGKKVVKR